MLFTREALVKKFHIRVQPKAQRFKRLRKGKPELEVNKPKQTKITNILAYGSANVCNYNLSDVFISLI